MTITPWYRAQMPTVFGDNSGYRDREAAANPQTYHWYDRESEDPGYDGDDHDPSAPSSTIET